VRRSPHGSSVDHVCGCELPRFGGTMAAVCQVTGAVPGFGHNISHSHRRTKRRFDPNVQKKKYYVPSLRRTITLTLSAKGIKVIDARGIESVVQDLLARGEKI